MLSRSEDWALLLGRAFIAALFLPSGFGKLMSFSSFAGSLAAKGFPYPSVVAGILVAIKFLGPLALIIGLWARWTALALITFSMFTLWSTYGTSIMGFFLSPRQHVEFFERLAIVGGLFLYFASGPGGVSRTSLR